MKFRETSLVLGAIFLLFNSAMAQENHIQFEQPLVPLFECDNASVISQLFVFDYAYRQSNQDGDYYVQFTPSNEGTLAFQGNTSDWNAFITALEGYLDEPLSYELFLDEKKYFALQLSAVGALFERDLVLEMDATQLEEAYVALREIVRSLYLPINTLEQLEQLEEQYQAFYALRLTPQDEQNITKLIKKLETFKKIQVFKGIELKLLGDKVEVVHPLRFIGFIMFRSDVRRHLERMRSHNKYTWKQFIEGFGNRMSLEAQHDQLDQYLPGFCQYLNVSLEDVQHYCQDSQWEQLVCYLLNH